jgi:hypothetical protein
VINRLRSVGKLYGGHQAAVTAMTVGSAPVSGTASCVITGSKDRCLKVRVPYVKSQHTLRGVIFTRATKQKLE